MKYRVIEMKKHMVIPVFIPHKGCPFDCIYCDQKTISGQTEEMTIEKMNDIITSHLKWVAEDTTIEIGFYGGSFTGIDKDEQIRFLTEANKYIATGKVRSVRLSTRPDYINEEILEYLKYYNVSTIELGVQSLDDEVLEKSHRGHTANDVITSSRLIKKYDISLGIQTMIGLPGDSKEKDIETARKVIELGPDVVRIYPALVIRGTFMEKMYRKGEYSPLSLEEAVEICSKLMKMYQEKNINVIRVGLQPTETINEHMDVVAGPFHPAFRQLVESKLALSKIEELIKKQNLKGAKELVLTAHPANISNIVGQKKQNILYLREKYNIPKIRIQEDSSLKDEIDIKIL